ncbi:RagB/SusD family nutrient uptake outer membrane protein [Myroides odoratus]|uniref:SusD family n=1 Tax=Myroides odoratus TaxID=256 RepID=A0A378U2H2_MYROD|nr:RagB/SusD family nutrient uptake outer membrane protein [Myroides odoratus]QQU03841.1 RagB/SusD family nutrient uptake outer membrane protein [Myroides odoratus]STZ68874.1 SusD family [Myroides odoratus]
MKRTLKQVWIFVAMASISLASCSLDPKITENVDYEKNPISTSEELGANLVGTYALMTNPNYYGNNILAFSEVRSDNAYSTNRTNRLGNVSSSALTTSARYTADTWKQIYLVISETNRAIEANVKEDNDVINLKGQAYALRALAHYDALRIYGQQYVDNKGLDAVGIPYITKYAAIKADVSRGTVAANRADIYADLDKAIELLTKANSGSKIKISLAAAYGLKARVALFFSNWDNADLLVAKENAKQAMESSNSGIIDRFAFVSSYSADDAQSNSIFELKQSGVDNPGTDSLFYLYLAPAAGGYGDIVVNFKVEDLFETDAPEDILDGEGKVIETIPANDIRADRAMIDVVRGDLRNLAKYPKMASNLKLMRFEELVLIFVEADFRINNGITAESLGYFNALKKKRLTTFTDLTTYTLDDIRIERQKELLFEGFGFEDLMRFHLPVVNRYGTVEYGKSVLAFPIPQSEINASGIPQNKGY